jgi:chromosome segregation ATPase
VCTRTIPELTVSSAETLIGSLTKLRSLLAGKSREISIIRAGGGVAELQLRRTELAGQIQALKNEHTREVNKASIGKTKELHVLLDDIAETRAKTYSHKTILEHTPVAIRQLELENEALRGKWAVIDEELFDSEICLRCGQAIQGEKANELRSVFNQKKAEQLEEIQTTGKENAIKIGHLEDKIEISKSELLKIETLIARKQKQADRIQSEIKHSKTSAPDLEELPEYIDAIKKQKKLQCEIESLGAGNGELIVRVEKEKEVIEAQVAESEKQVAAIEQSHKCQDRIEELKAQEKKLSADYEHLEGHLYLIEQFIRAKVSMLEEKINDKFSLVSFRLFKNQINEGLQECCEVTVGGVPFNSLNSAAKVQSGLDIIKTLSDYYGFAPLVFIDNRESVTSLPEMKCQAISLVVSPKDKKLRIETIKQLAEAA